MKQILLFSLLILTASVNAQVINIPDANFKNKLLTDNFCAFTATDNPLIVDADSDGNIEANEVAPIAKLYLPNASIADITGLEAFVNLVQLDLVHNDIVSLTPLNGLP